MSKHLEFICADLLKHQFCSIYKESGSVHGWLIDSGRKERFLDRFPMKRGHKYS